MASLIYHAGALGDFVTTLPAMALWKAGHPGEPMVLLGRPAHAPLGAHLFDETWDAGAAEFAPLFSPAGGLPPGAGIWRRLAAFSSALVFAAASSALPDVLRRRGLAEVVRQDPFPSSPKHVVDYHLELFEGRFREDDRIPRLPAADLGLARRGVALHPGSGSPRKNWPRERLEALASALAAGGEGVAWVTGPVEEGDPPAGGAEAWRSLPLDELAERLAARRLFVGNDSGVTHLAAAAGCPVVALFGGSDHLVWAPRGPRVAVMVSASGRMDGLSLNDVLRVCLDFLGESR